MDSGLGKLHLILRRPKEGGTKMHGMQPLEKIGNNSEEYSELEELQEPIEESNCEPTGYGNICELCQIPSITGECNRCGLYQYGELFDMTVRRRR